MGYTHDTSRLWNNSWRSEWFIYSDYDWRKKKNTKENDFAEGFKNLARYRSKNNFIGSSNNYDPNQCYTKFWYFISLCILYNNNN